MSFGAASGKDEGESSGAASMSESEDAGGNVMLSSGRRATAERSQWVAHKTGQAAGTRQGNGISVCSYRAEPY